MKAFKVYPFNFAANGAQIVLAEGSYFRVKTATGDVAVQFDDNAPLGPINAGQGFKVPAGYKRLTVVDMSGAPNAGTVIVADGDFVDQQLSGVVQVIDGEKARTLAGGMYTGAPVQPGVAAQFGWVQLWNPATSGKNLIVTAVEFSGNAAVACNIIAYIGAVQRANIYGLAAMNKKGGGPAPVAQLRIEASAVADTFPSGVGRNMAIAISGTDNWQIKGALVVPPGYGLTGNNNIQNATFGMNVEWFEEAVQ